VIEVTKRGIRYFPKKSRYFTSVVEVPKEYINSLDELIRRLYSISFFLNSS